MERRSKKEIKEALDKLRDHKQGAAKPEYISPKLEGKKANKNRIRKQGI